MCFCYSYYVLPCTLPCSSNEAKVEIFFLSCSVKFKLNFDLNSSGIWKTITFLHFMLLQWNLQEWQLRKMLMVNISNDHTELHKGIPSYPLLKARHQVGSVQVNYIPKIYGLRHLCLQCLNCLFIILEVLQWILFPAAASNYCPFLPSLNSHFQNSILILELNSKQFAHAMVLKSPQ